MASTRKMLVGVEDAHGFIWAPSVELSAFATSHAFRAERRILAAPSAR